MAALEERHLADLRFADVSRALRALSSAYVERRSRLRHGVALDGVGKRAAFALFYGPIHYLLIQRIVAELDATIDCTTLVDLGCGTGAAGAAWATKTSRPPVVVGFDRHPWAIAEAARTYRDFGLTGRTRCADITTATLPAGRVNTVVAYALNELGDTSRNRLVGRLIDRLTTGNALLVVEPLATSAARWWPACSELLKRAGARVDQWRFPIELPPIVAKLDRAAGLDHRELTGRSIFLSRR